MMICRINSCKLPVNKYRVHYDGKTPEPKVDEVCINEYGYHDHETNTWYRFENPRVSNKRFEKDKQK